MGHAAPDLLRTVLELPEEQRTELAVRILETLPLPSLQDRPEASWIEEIERRADVAKAGDPGVPWPEARRRAEERLRRR